MPKNKYPYLSPNVTADGDYPSPFTCVSFSETGKCFALTTRRGFMVYFIPKLSPPSAWRIDFDAGFDAIEMLSESNILTLIRQNGVIIWDESQKGIIGSRAFESEVRAVRVGRDFIVVVLEEQILIHNSEYFEVFHQIETISNPKGLCDISRTTDALLVVCPGLQKGKVRVEHIGGASARFINVHSSQIESLAVSRDGQLLATGSNREVLLVQIFNTANGNKLHEFAMGENEDHIYRIAFSPLSKWLAVSSHNGAVYAIDLNLQFCPSREQKLIEHKFQCEGTQYVGFCEMMVWFK